MITSHTKLNGNRVTVTKVVQISSLGKQYPLQRTPQAHIPLTREEFWALHDISFNVYQGEIVGIVGRNGAGKTTLLNIIAGVLSPTQGRVSVHGRVVGLFNLGVGFQDELTGRENIFLNGALLGATKKELQGRIDDIVAFSELGDFIDMPLGTYSQGMRLRLGFSIIANLDFDILIIDEVLAVGDVLFQNKCFQRLMECKRQRKTLILTSQSTDLIERLCDRVILLDHGKLFFEGEPSEGFNAYRALLATEKFYVGPQPMSTEMVTDTKKWVEDISEWGTRLGTKEVVITKVEFRNGFGWNSRVLKSGSRLKIRVHFIARNVVKYPHFGVAIFRADGVYCYGPNTQFEGYRIPEIKEGKGWFELEYEQMLLAPGEYRISIAIWDRKETLAFDYHSGYYKLYVKGRNPTGQLLVMPFRIDSANLFHRIVSEVQPDVGALEKEWNKHYEGDGVKIESVKLLNKHSRHECTFTTTEPLKVSIDISGCSLKRNNVWLWVGIYREDGIYCQGITLQLCSSVRDVWFPHLMLLPGVYRLSVGVWDNASKKFLAYHHAMYPFHMIFARPDHGTVYLEHTWRWRLSR